MTARFPYSRADPSRGVLLSLQLGGTDESGPSVGTRRNIDMFKILKESRIKDTSCSCLYFIKWFWKYYLFIWVKTHESPVLLAFEFWLKKKDESLVKEVDFLEGIFVYRKELKRLNGGSLLRFFPDKEAPCGSGLKRP